MVAERLLDGSVRGARLVGVVARRNSADVPARVLTLEEALATCDVVVECAGQEALRLLGPAVIEAGKHLVASSIGALVDGELMLRLRAGPGRLVCTPGAIGGLELLQAASNAARFDGVRVRTTKRPAALVQEWMTPARAAELVGASTQVEVFSGPPADAARLFPESLNVAATVALAVGSDCQVTVELLADPEAELTTHEITAWGPVGRYRWAVQNRPSEDNPRTSAVVPYAVLRSIAGLTAYPPLIG